MSIGHKKRQAIFVRDGGRCSVCKKILHYDRSRFNDRNYMQIDHVKPQSAGGSHDIKNLRAICKSCNSRRKNFTSNRLVEIIEKKVTAAEVDVTRITEEYSCEALSEEQVLEIISLYEDYIYRSELSLSHLKRMIGMYK